MFVKSQFSKLPNHLKLGEIILTDVLMDAVAANLYPSAKWDEKLIYSINEGGYALKPDMIDEVV